MAAFADLSGVLTYAPLERPVECEERVSPFSAPWQSTLRLLRDELRHLEAERVVMEIDVRARDIRQDGMVREGRKAKSSVMVVSFAPTAIEDCPDLRYEVGTFLRWTDNVRALALSLEKLRAVDRYGVTKRGEQYRGWKQLGAGTGAGEGNPARGRVLIAAAGGNWKRAAALAHPDVNDEARADDFKDVIAARDEQLERERAA